MARSLGTGGGGRGFVLLLFIYLLFSYLLLIFFWVFFGIFFPTFGGLPSCSFIFCFLIFYLSFFWAGFVSFFYCLLNPSFFSILSLTFLSSTYVYGSFWVLFFSLLFSCSFVYYFFYLLLIFLLSFWPFFLLPLGDWSFKIVTACVYKWQFLVSSFFTPDDVLHTWHVPWHDPMV